MQSHRRTKRVRDIHVKASSVRFDTKQKGLSNRLRARACPLPRYSDEALRYFTSTLSLRDATSVRPSALGPDGCACFSFCGPGGAAQTQRNWSVHPSIRAFHQASCTRAPDNGGCGNGVLSAPFPRDSMRAPARNRLAVEAIVMDTHGLGSRNVNTALSRSAGPAMVQAP